MGLTMGHKLQQTRDRAQETTVGYPLQQTRGRALPTRQGQAEGSGGRLQLVGGLATLEATMGHTLQRTRDQAQETTVGYTLQLTQGRPLPTAPHKQAVE